MIGTEEVKATKTLVRPGNSARKAKWSVDKRWGAIVFRPFFRLAEASEATLPGSSVAEQVTVNHLVAGSIPARAAIPSFCHEVTENEETRLRLSLSVAFKDATD